MDPTRKKKFGSLLDALQSNCFNLQSLEKEISGIVSPGETETTQKKETNQTPFEGPSTSRNTEFSFVRHNQSYIPGLSIPQDEPSSWSERRDSSGSHIPRRHTMLGGSFRSGFRGRGGMYGREEPRFANRGFKRERQEDFVKKEFVKQESIKDEPNKEETPSSSLLADSSGPAPKSDPFAEHKRSESRDRRSSGSEGGPFNERHSSDSTRGFGARPREGFYQGGPNRGARGHDRGGREYDRGGRGHDRGGRGHDRGGRGHDRGSRSRGTGFGTVDRNSPNFRGRPQFGVPARGQFIKKTFRRHDDKSDEGYRGPRRAPEKTQEEQEEVYQRSLQKAREVENRMRKQMGLPTREEEEEKAREKEKEKEKNK